MDNQATHKLVTDLRAKLVASLGRLELQLDPSQREYLAPRKGVERLIELLGIRFLILGKYAPTDIDNLPLGCTRASNNGL